MHDKGNTLTFALQRQFFAVIWFQKWFEATFETLIIIIFWGVGRGINLFVKNAAYKLIDKNFKTWLKISSQN